MGQCKWLSLLTVQEMLNPASLILSNWTLQPGDLPVKSITTIHFNQVDSLYLLPRIRQLQELHLELNVITKITSFIMNNGAFRTYTIFLRWAEMNWWEISGICEKLAGDFTFLEG